MPMVCQEGRDSLPLEGQGRIPAEVAVKDGIWSCRDGQWGRTVEEGKEW